MPPDWYQLGLHVIAKPIGPMCNLRCDYCFYLDKQSLYESPESWRMSDETLRAYVQQYIDAQPEGIGEIDFAFQGGEPTLLGLDFFRRVVQLQQEFARPGLRIHNSLQTNGILLDDAWCEFLREHNFLVGLSIDGPVNLHDKFRRDPQGRGTFHRVTESMRLLFRHGVEFNALCCVHRHNADHAGRVYRFLRDSGITFLQFIPIVERATQSGSDELASERSVRPEQFGRFMCEVFDEWVHNDVGRVYVRDFDQALAAFAGGGATLCVYSKHCGRATAIEHNGDLYSCDHYVDRPHLLGNIHDTPIRELANLARQEKFGRDKEATLPEFCRGCEWLFACNGACPKDRFTKAPNGQPGLHYLCEGYRAFFEHISATMWAMAAELQAGRPAAGVMHRLRAERQQATATGDTPPRRNAPCPCGSGRKFKQCCLRR